MDGENFVSSEPSFSLLDMHYAPFQHLVLEEFYQH